MLDANHKLRQLLTELNENRGLTQLTSIIWHMAFVFSLLHLGNILSIMFIYHVGISQKIHLGCLLFLESQYLCFLWCNYIHYYFLQVGMMLPGMGVDNSTRVYVAFSKIYNAETSPPFSYVHIQRQRYLSILADELAPFKVHGNNNITLHYLMCFKNFTISRALKIIQN